MKPIQLYDYQRIMLRRIEEELDEPSGRVLHFSKTKNVKLGNSVMVQMPTGTGKTYVMAAVIRRMVGDGDIWVVAHRRELVEQMKETLTRFGIAYRESSDMDKVNNANVCVMSVQWLARNIKKIMVHPKLIIIDEAHHSIAPTYQEMWASFPEALKLGFTATPCRLKAAGFNLLYDKLLLSWRTSKFIETGRLSRYEYIVINKDSEDQHIIDCLEKRDASGDYSTQEMDEKLNVDPAIVRLYRSVDTFAHGKKGIVYAINIRHAKRIAEYYMSQGLRAVAIDSKTPTAERTRIVEYFKQGRIDCLVNVNLFDEGFDCPDVEYIQMARPTLSLAKYLQMVGRGLRAHPDKELCVLIDNAGLCRMFGLPDDDRDWQSTFYGMDAGRGRPDRNRKKNLKIVNNDMEVIVNHSHIAMTDEEEQEFKENVQPYEKGGCWGLRSDEETVLAPIYKKIEPFVGNYAAYSIADGRWGVLSRQGHIIIGPDYKEVQILPIGKAILLVNNITTTTVDLRKEEKEVERRREAKKQDLMWEVERMRKRLLTKQKREEAKRAMEEALKAKREARKARKAKL